jgi:hypothetical protein
MAWVAEVVKTQSQAQVVDSRYESFSRFAQPLLHKLTIASLSTSGNKAAVASQLLKYSDGFASNSEPPFPASANCILDDDHAVAELLIAEIVQTLVHHDLSDGEDAVKLIRSHLAQVCRSHTGTAAILAPVLPQLPEPVSGQNQGETISNSSGGSVLS